MMTMREALDEIRGSIRRGRGTFALTSTSAGQAAKPYSLTVGSIRAIDVERGVIIALGLSREQVVKLRAMCDELLADSASEAS